MSGAGARRRGTRAAIAAMLAVAAIASVAVARPVPIGRYAEIPYGVSPEHAWPTTGGDARRTGRAHAAAPPASPSMQWEAVLRAGRLHPPAVAADGTLYVGTAVGVSAIEPGGGVRWTARIGSTSGTPSLTPEDQLAVGTHAGEVVLVGRDGHVRWRTPVGGAVQGSPLVLPDGSVIVGAFDLAVHRLDAEGRRMFRAPVEERITGSIALADRRMLAVPSGRMVVWMTVDGEVRGRVPVGQDVVAGPAVADDGTVWVLTGDGAIHALEPGASVRSRTELGVRVSLTQTIAVGTDGAVRVGAREPAFLSIGPNGTERWRVGNEGIFPGGVTVDPRGVAVTIDQNGAMYAFEPDGSLRWRLPLASNSLASPVVGSDGTVYVVTQRGTIQAWR